MGRIVAFMAFLVLLAALGWSAYESGSKLAEMRITDVEASNARLTTERDTARADLRRIEATLAAERQSRADLQKRYDSEVPSGQNAELFALLQQRLRSGLAPARAAQILREAAETKACDTRTTRRRFPIVIGAGKPAETVTLLDGLIAVSASATSPDPRTTTVLVTPAWLAEPIKLDGLPARHDILVNNLVLKLTVEPSEVAGFANAILSGCGKL